MTVYDDSFMDNVTSLLNFTQGIGNSVNEPYLFGYVILLCTFMIFLILSYRYDMKQVLMVDGFICTIVSILLFASGLLPASMMVVPMVLFMFTAVINFMQN